jgi:hypothetical protein
MINLRKVGQSISRRKIEELLQNTVMVKLLKIALEKVRTVLIPKYGKKLFLQIIVGSILISKFFMYTNLFTSYLTTENPPVIPDDYVDNYTEVFYDPETGQLSN